MVVVGVALFFVSRWRAKKEKAAEEAALREQAERASELASPPERVGG